MTKPTPQTQIAPIVDTVVHEKLSELEHLIKGNGEPGINERVRIIERDMKAIKALAWIILLGVLSLVGNKLWDAVEAPKQAEAAMLAKE